MVGVPILATSQKQLSAHDESYNFWCLLLEKRAIHKLLNIHYYNPNPTTHSRPQASNQPKPLHTRPKQPSYTTPLRASHTKAPLCAMATLGGYLNSEHNNTHTHTHTHHSSQKPPQPTLESLITDVCSECCFAETVLIVTADSRILVGELAACDASTNLVRHVISIPLWE